MRLLTVQQMRAVEKAADARGLTYDMMMENAGRRLADEIVRLSTGTTDPRVFALVGPGNNGGDALVALAYLAQTGWKTGAYLIHRSKDALVRRFAAAGGAVMSAVDDRDGKIMAAGVQAATILVDGVLGTGFRPPVTEEVSAPMARVAQLLATTAKKPIVVAVDCPSGVDCDSGSIHGTTIPADLTVTMAAAKKGLLRFPAFGFVGELRAVDIGVQTELSSLPGPHVEVADADTVAALLPKRPAEAHKGTFGTALVIAGSVNYSGAALLAGRAAYRVGAGLVRMAVPSPLHGALAGHFPEAVWVLLPNELGVISKDATHVALESLDRVTAMLLGPGLGTQQTTFEFVQALLSPRPGQAKSEGRIGFIRENGGAHPAEGSVLPPLVVDADGLRHLIRIREWSRHLPPDTVLTPHPGEMAALTNLPVGEVQENRQEVASRFAAEWGHVVVLKGAITVVASPDGSACLIPVATPALARAGTGDVLAGAIVGLRAQGMPAYDAAVAAAWIHAQAGKAAEARIGASASVLAGDVLDSLATVLRDLS